MIKYLDALNSLRIDRSAALVGEEVWCVAESRQNTVDSPYQAYSIPVTQKNLSRLRSSGAERSQGTKSVVSIITVQKKLAPVQTDRQDDTKS